MREEKIASSFAWKFMERISAQFINLIVQIVLARVIAPKDFGIMAILVVFVNIAAIFVQKGLSSSLIRKKNADKIDFDTAWIAGVTIAFILYAILFAAAPFLAELYHVKQLQPGLRAISISLFFGSLYCVQNAVLVRELKFKAIFIRGLAASLLSGAIGIAMALQGLGIWALVAQTVSNQMLLCITAWNQAGWIPGIHFSFERLREIMSFGGKILLSELLSYGVESIRTLAIGIYDSSEALSYYDRGQTYPAALMRGIYDTIGGVLLPVFSKEQNHQERMAGYFKKIVSFLMFLIAPLFVGFAAASKTIVPLFLTDKWVLAAPFVTIFCFAQLAQPIQGVCRQVIYACGKSNAILKIEIIKDLISLTLLLAALKISIYAIAISFLISMYIAAGLMVAAVGTMIPVKTNEILRGMGRTAMYSVFMFFAVLVLNALCVKLFFKLILQVMLGSTVYFGLAFLTRDQNFNYGLKIIKKYTFKR